MKLPIGLGEGAGEGRNSRLSPSKPGENQEATEEENGERSG